LTTDATTRENASTRARPAALDVNMGRAQLPSARASEDGPERTEWRRPLLLVLALAVVAAFWVLGPESPRAAPPTAGERVVAFGDSLVQGVGATPGSDLVSVLSERLGVPIVNAGRSGDTTATALGRLEPAVLSQNPRIVIVLLGGNDYLRRVPPAQTFANLEAIVGRIRNQGAAVILVGLSLGVFSDSYGDGYRDVARRASAGLVPDVLDGILGRGDLMADQIHPNDRGYALMADRIEPALRDLLR
jgi:acyl-CoA thioesterase-1